MKIVDGKAGVALAGGVTIKPMLGPSKRTIAAVVIDAPSSCPVVIRGSNLRVEVMMPDTVTKWYVTGKLFGAQIQPIECESEAVCKLTIDSICSHLIEPKVHAALQYGSAEVEVHDGNA